MPEIHFAGKVLMDLSFLLLHGDCIRFCRLHVSYINGRQVLVQERLPGVGLSVVWAYLSQAQKESFKQQARTILL